ncbi:helicase (plasmid) [Arthrobacter sp. TES]|nr:helicase [Arthrobacter sp. TES]
MIDPFGVLADIASLTFTEGRTGEVRELVIRALDRSVEFGTEQDMLTALARDHGLFPYLDADRLSFRDLIAAEMHRPDGLPGIVFHSEQAAVYRDLMDGRSVILSAPTSFGKSLITDAVIASGTRKNIVILVPTIALIDETRRRLAARFPSFKIVTHPGQTYDERNIFVLTQERYLALEDLPTPDFFFVDEFYKLDEADGESDEHALTGRASLLNAALYRLLKTRAQFYMAGPNIRALDGLLPDDFQATLRVTDYSTVAADLVKVTASNDQQRATLVQAFAKALDGPTLIYAQSPPRVRSVVGWLMEDVPNEGFGAGMPDAADWLVREYHPEWDLPKALRAGVGTHHGRLPRWLAQMMVEGFNGPELNVLVANTTLTEGVNTSAKNVLILDKKVGRRPYDYFTWANIKGRGGRSFAHMIGRVILFHEPPQEEPKDVDVPVLSQSDAAPEGLLLTIDEQDRSETTKERLRPILEQQDLSVEVITANAGIEVEDQLRLARHLLGLAPKDIANLTWSTSHPNWDQLTAVINLIWEYLPPEHLMSHGARSAAQLTLFVNWAATANGDTRALIQRFTTHRQDRGAAQDVNSSLETYFDFSRFWLDHHLPNRLRALTAIGREVLQRRGFVPGSYDSFAARVEDGFQPRFLVLLEEYGIPVQVSKKLVRRMRRYETLDELITNLKGLREEDLVGLDSFERGLLNRALKSM